MHVSTDKESLFRSWVHAHSDALHAYARQRGFDEASARDLLQDTFLAAWRGADTYRGEASVRNWLFTILKNRITDRYRRSATRPVVEALTAEGGDDAFFDADGHWAKEVYPRPFSADARVEQKDFQRVLGGCRARLKELQNHVFALKYLEGFDSERICGLLNLTAANYWVLLHRAKVQLRACLQKNWIQK